MYVARRLQEEKTKIGKKATIKKIQLICKIEKVCPRISALGRHEKSLVFCRLSSLNRENPELEGKGHEPSRAELKIVQLEPWLEPARLGLITSRYIVQKC